MTNTPRSTPTISAMELRREPGKYLDRVDYRRERFIIERAGRPKAALISVAELEQVEMRKREAKKRLWAKIQTMRKAFAKVKPEEAQRIIDEAITAVRQGKRNTP